MVNVFETPSDSNNAVFEEPSSTFSVDAEAFNQACHELLQQHIQEISDADELSELLALMETYKIRGLVNESIQRLLSLMESSYKSAHKKTASSISWIKYRRKYSELLKSCFKDLERQLERFDERISKFRASLRSWTSEHDNESWDGALAGSIIGGMLLGPLGAIGGAFLGCSGGTSASHEFEVEFKSLLSSYAGVLQQVENSLNECLEISGECLVEILENSVLPETSPALLEG